MAQPGRQTPLFAIVSNLLAFVTKENAAFSNMTCSYPARDVNGDGDTSDRVIRYINLNGSLTTAFAGPTISENTETPFSSSAGPDTALLGTDATDIAYSMLEPTTNFFGTPPCTSDPG